MTLRPVSLPAGVSGTLWLSAMPGREGPWVSFEDEARRTALAVVVCLTPLEEVRDLSPEYHQAILKRVHGFEWLNLPMRNFGPPHDASHFRGTITRLADRIRAGDAVLLHCAAGMGRTGTAAACVLKALGQDVTEALEAVRLAGSNPQNALQSGLVHWF